MADKKQTMTFTDFLRVRFKKLLDPIGAFLNKLGLTPNMITIFGLLGNIVAAFLIAKGYIFWGGVFILLTAPMDAIDGTMARLRGKVTKYGAFLDSVSDRYSELMVYGGLLYYFLNLDQTLACLLVFFSAVGSVMVSYTRARAEAVQYQAKIGIMTRIERYLVLVPMLLINRPIYAVWILAVFTNITAIQRVLSVRQQAIEADDIIRMKKS